MPGPNQLQVQRAEVQVTRADLLQVPEGAITEAGLRGSSASACSTSSRGCAATAACRSIT